MRENGWEPLEPYPGAMKKWRCIHVACGLELSPTYARIQQGQRACKNCSNQKTRSKLSLNPDEAAAFMRAAGYEPLTPYPGNNNSPWRCIHLECGREVSPRYAGIQQGQGGCKPCHQDYLSRLYRTSDIQAEVIVRARGFEPLEPFPGNIHSKWKIRHLDCGKTVTPSLSNLRNSRGPGCAYCTGHRVDPEDAVAMMRAAGLEPLEPFVRTNRPWRCMHVACGREVQPRLNGIQQGQGGCLSCGRGEVSEKSARSLFESAGLVPQEPFRGTAYRWESIHTKCGKTVRPFYSNIQQGGAGCVYCSNSSFDFTGPGLVYLLQHDDFYSLKIGVTSASSRVDRVREHGRSGWRLIKQWHIGSGLKALEIEASVLNWWRNELGAPQSILSENMPSGGWTETVALIHVDADQVIDWVEAQPHF